MLDPETDFVARELTKKIKSQPPAELPVDNSKAVAAIQGTFYSFTPYDAAPRGPLNSWLFSGLSTGAASVVTFCLDVQSLDIPYMKFIPYVTFFFKFQRELVEC